MSEHTKAPWRHIELVNEDGSSLTPDDAAEYSANTAKHGTTGFYAVQAIKEDGKPYNVCFVGNGPDSIYNGAHIVHCVNNHEILVDALRNAIAVVDGEGGTECVDKARALLAALEAEKGGE